MPIAISTPPTGPAIDPEVVKRHLGIEHSADDLTILELIAQAEALIQDECELQLAPASATSTLDKFPCGNTPIELARPPVREIVAVIYRDADGAAITMDEEDFQFDASSVPPRIAPVPGGCWPVTECGRLAAVSIEFLCGSASVDAVPDAARRAILWLVATWYENRETAEVRLRDANGQLPDNPFLRRQLDLLRWV